MIFGIPYAGSKNIYAKDVVSALPSGNRLVERMERLERSSVPYWDYRYMIGDVVYCDIPYKQTCCKQYGERQFNHDAFWQWASTRFFDVYVSERTVPDYAEILLNRSIPSRASNKGVDKKVAEYLVRVGGRKCQSKQ